MFGISLIMVAQAAFGSTSIEVPELMTEPWRQYLICVQTQTNGPSKIVHPDSEVYEEKLRQAVAACEEVRATSYSTADAALKADAQYAEDEHRANVINRALDGVVDSQRALHAVMYGSPAAND